MLKKCYHRKCIGGTLENQFSTTNSCICFSEGMQSWGSPVGWCQEGSAKSHQDKARQGQPKFSNSWELTKSYARQFSLEAFSSWTWSDWFGDVWRAKDQVCQHASNMTHMWCHKMETAMNKEDGGNISILDNVQSCFRFPSMTSPWLDN